MNEVKKVTFYTDDVEISSKEAFDLVYSGLDQLIEINNKGESTYGVSNKDSIVRSMNSIRRPNAIKKWRDGMTNISAKIDGKEYYVYSAPPFEEFIKEPDILFLKYSGEPSEPNIDYVVRRLHERDPVKHYRPYKKSIEKRCVVPLPEEMILTVNEKLLENNIPPIIYNPLMKWEDDGQSFILRNTYPSITDFPLGRDDAETYVAILAELRILSKIEDKLEEYMIDHWSTSGGKLQTAMINIDPDFWAIAMNKWNNYGELGEIYLIISQSITPPLTVYEFEKGVKEKRKDLRDKHGPVLDEIYADVVGKVLKEK